MITQHLFFSLLLTSGAIAKPSAEEISYTWLEEHHLVLVLLPDGFVNAAVGRQQVKVVELARQNVLRGAIDISANGFVDELVPQQIGLGGHVGRDGLPELGEVIEEASLVGKEISLEPHDVTGEVELSKGLHIEAVFKEGKTFLIIADLDWQRKWE